MSYIIGVFVLYVFLTLPLSALPSGRIQVFSRSTISNFFLVKLTRNAPTAPEWNRNQEKKLYQEAIVMTEGIQVSFTYKNCLQ